MRKVLFLFGQLRDQDIDWLIQVGRVEILKEGQQLIKQGGDIDRLSILLEGGLRVTVDKIGEVAQLAPGEIVGEMSYVNSLPTSANVLAAMPSKVLSISRSVLTEHLGADLEFASRFYKSIAMFLADRLRSTVQRLGYGKSEANTPGPKDELDEMVLDSVYMAGLRFERLVNTLAAGAARQ